VTTAAAGAAGAAGAPVRCAVADGVARLTLASPPLNILTRAALAELRRHLDALERDATLRAVVLGAEGKHFSAGADVGEHLAPTYEVMIPEFVATIARLADFPAPVIAAVRGRCLGGGFELVQAADLVVAGEGAVFGQPEIVLGVLPPAACALLPALCGRARAAELVLTGDTITAVQARAFGLVARLVPDDQVDAEAGALAGRLARHSAAALRLTKRALRAGGAGARAAEALRAAERLYLDELMATRDAVEGLNAFLAKRTPTWTHG
jgi:cyclohexa-1,5-dienecarbonyl-CoA hydratase